jgi:hypothetical protein
MAVYLYTEESKTGMYNLVSFKLPNGEIYLSISGEDPEDALTTLRSQAKSTTAGKGAKAFARELDKLGDNYNDKIKTTVHGTNLSKDQKNTKIARLISNDKIKVNKLANKQIPL